MNPIILRTLIAIAGLALVLHARAQGSLTPPGVPAPVMKTLAQVEPRTAITNSGSVMISMAGSYYLTTNITVGNGNGINITANNVTLDLNGFTISSTANPASGTGIFLGGSRTNITIVNGFIYGAVTNNGAAAYGGSGFGYGIYYTGNQSVNVRVANLSVSGCFNYGIYLNATVGNSGNTVDSCLVNDCGVFGIVADVVLDSVVYSGTGSAIFSSTASRSRGVSYSSEGLHAATTAESCSGQSTSWYGVNANTTRRCYGLSSSSIGLNVGHHADTCYGQTVAGGYAIDAALATDNCYGNHTGTGGYGLWASQIAIGCYGTSGGAGSVGIHGRILNCCQGNATGGTNVTFSYKYNMP